MLEVGPGGHWCMNFEVSISCDNWKETGLEQDNFLRLQGSVELLDGLGTAVYA